MSEVDVPPLPGPSYRHFKFIVAVSMAFFISWIVFLGFNQEVAGLHTHREGVAVLDSDFETRYHVVDLDDGSRVKFRSYGKPSFFLKEGDIVCRHDWKLIGKTMPDSSDYDWTLGECHD